MKSFAKILLVGAVAMMAIAVSAAPSEAAKKKAAKAACGDGGMCASNCASGSCQVNICGADNQLHLAVLTPLCVEAHCPPKCR